jgi:predicted transcriptional regulator of viral defense system
VAQKVTFRRRLYERALDQYGYITTRDALELGIPSVEVRKLHQRGGLERVGHGVYRFEAIPASARDQFMEAVLLAGPDAFLVGDAVLALHDLALVNPKTISVATPHRVRRQLPRHVRLEYRRPGDLDLAAYEGIPTTTVERALRDCRNQVMSSRLLEAVHDAARRGLGPAAAVDDLQEELTGRR